MSKKSRNAAVRVDPDSRVVVYAVVGLVAALAIVSFILGVPGLMTVGSWAGLPLALRWGVPVMLDGGIIIASLVAMVNRQREESSVFSWSMVAVLTLASMAAQATHVWVTASDPRALTALVGAALAAAFPASVWAATHLMIRTAVVPAPADAAPPARPRPRPAPAAPTTTEPTPEPSRPALPPSEREARIAAMHAEGRSSREIAAVVGLHPSTVQRTIRRMGLAA